MSGRFRYAAFLRGVNMIGRRTVKMADLRRIFESIDLQDVTTVLSSGNVTFATRRANVAALSRTIERRVERRLGYPVGVMVRRLDELEAMAAMDPFRGVPRGPRTKLLITLLSSPPDGAFHAPYSAPERDFTILRVSDDAVFTVVTLADGKRSSGVLNFLERQFGTDQTTRNWNTILKVLQTGRSGHEYGRTSTRHRLRAGGR